MGREAFMSAVMKEFLSAFPGGRRMWDGVHDTVLGYKNLFLTVGVFPDDTLRIRATPGDIFMYHVMGPEGARTHLQMEDGAEFRYGDIAESAKFNFVQWTFSMEDWRHCPRLTRCLCLIAGKSFALDHLSEAVACGIRDALTPLGLDVRSNERWIIATHEKREFIRVFFRRDGWVVVHFCDPRLFRPFLAAGGDYADRRAMVMTLLDGDVFDARRVRGGGFESYFRSPSDDQDVLDFTAGIAHIAANKIALAPQA